MLIAIALAPFVFVYQITRLAHSTFRNVLWTIRDGLVDDLRRGVVERSEGAERLLHLVQTHIDVAGRHTFADSTLGYLIYRPNDAASISDVILGDSVPPADRTRLNGYLRDLTKAATRHLKWASPTGWVGIPLLRLYFKAQGEWRKRQDKSRIIKEADLRREVERVELQVMPQLMPSRAARKRGDGGSVATVC
jgi:hypothetical protein